jgi:hypothetical protein
MSKEELLKRRFKIIADWPGSLFRIGDIFESVYGPSEVWESKRSGGKFLYNPSNYPALFEPLEWWQDRKPEDMPEYVMFVKEYMGYKKGSVYKYEPWGEEYGQRLKDQMIHFRTGNGEYDLHAVPGYFNQLLPATESEYQSFKQNQ